MKLFTVLATLLFLSNLVQCIPYLERYGRSSPHLARHERSQLAKHESKNEVLNRGFGLGFGGTVLGKRTQYYENMWPFSVRIKSDLLTCIPYLSFYSRFIVIWKQLQLLSLKSSFVTKLNLWPKNRLKIGLETACSASSWRVSTNKHQQCSRLVEEFFKIWIVGGNSNMYFVSKIVFQIFWHITDLNWNTLANKLLDDIKCLKKVSQALGAAH